ALAELLTDRLRVRGPDHSDTLKTKNELAYWLAVRQGQAGDAVGAAEALAALLADRLQMHGPDHPNTLRTRDQLAYWRGRVSVDEAAHPSADS
ncbi:hypothetical protein ACWGNR_06780, partial [Streptomyces althioticus]